jgi:hypothetical protein
MQDAVAQVFGSARARVPSTGEQPEPGQQGRGDQGSGLPSLTGKCLRLAADRTLDKPYLPRSKALVQEHECSGLIPDESPRLGSTREELGSTQSPWDG